MKINIAILALVATGCLHGQYKVSVPGAGLTDAFIGQNPRNGGHAGSAAGVCFSTQVISPIDSLIHTASKTCGALDSAGSRYSETVAQEWMLSNISSAPSDGANWSIFLRGAVLGIVAEQFQLVSDDHLTNTTWLEVDRSHMTVTKVAFPETLTVESLVFDADNTYSIGSGTVAPQNIFAIGLGIGRAGSHQGTLSINNTSSNPAPFSMLGTSGVATSGSDLAVGYLFGASSIYPINSSTDLGYSGGRYRKIWVNDIDLSGTCTGCGGAATDLSNLTNPTSINQSLLFSTTGFNIGSITTEAANVYSNSFSAGKPSSVGAISIFNGSNSNPSGISGASTTGTSVDLAVGNPFFAGSFYGLGTVTLGNSSFPWSTLYVTNVTVGGAAGFNGIKVAGACTITISAGIITNVTGC